LNTLWLLVVALVVNPGRVGMAALEEAVRVVFVLLLVLLLPLGLQSQLL